MSKLPNALQFIFELIKRCAGVSQVSPASPPTLSMWFSISTNAQYVTLHYKSYMRFMSQNPVISLEHNRWDPENKTGTRLRAPRVWVGGLLLVVSHLLPVPVSLLWVGLEKYQQLKTWMWETSLHTHIMNVCWWRSS